MCVSRTQKVFSKSLTASHTKCMFSEKCNSYRIAIQWFHVNQYLGIPYTKFQPYTSRVLGLGFFKRYSIWVPRLYWFKIIHADDRKNVKLKYNLMLNDITERPHVKNWVSLVKNMLSNLCFFHVWVSQGVGDEKYFYLYLGKE